MTRPQRAACARSAFTVVDLVVGVVLLAVVACVGSCWGWNQRGDSNRLRCGNNLRQIALAMFIYANENRAQVFPRTRFAASKPLIPVFGTGVTATDPFAPDGPAPNDVTAAIFLILRSQDVTPGVFTCPSTRARPDDLGGAAANQRSNFSDYRRNLSYSMHVPYGPPGWGSNLSADFPIMADMNPGTSGGNDNVLSVTLASDAKALKAANSNNHEEDGQSVLFGDGHVEWLVTPFVGIQRDNIYTRAAADPAARPDGNDGVIGVAQDANDSIMLPTDD